MMQVKTYLDISKMPNAGIGLFVKEFIPKGTIVWKFTSGLDKEYTQEEYLKMSSLDRDFIDIYSFMYNGKYVLCVDNARFFNHSDTPNCNSGGHNENSLGYTMAVRDIQIGEELTDDYSTFGFNEKDLIYNKIF